jgi:hypothetical protein
MDRMSSLVGSDARAHALVGTTRAGRAAFAATALAALLAAACGGAPSTSAQPPGRGDVTDRELRTRATVDPRPFFSETPPKTQRSWVMPRAARLEVGDRVASPEADPIEPVEVMIVEPGPTMIRVATALPGARFAVWIDRQDLFAVMAREVSVRAPFTQPASEIGITLRSFAPVEILEKEEERSKVRYSGAIELETWVPNDSLTWEAEPELRGGMVLGGGKVLHATPGLAIRAEPRWGGQQLAALAKTYFISEVRAVDDAWSEVRYSDGEVSVRGYASRRDPPVKLARRAPASQPSSSLATDDKLPAGTCLHARARGEVVGISNDVAVAVAEGEGEGWMLVTMETPWGPLAFAARKLGGSWQPCEAVK